ncbi:MAG: amidohydrolase family protein [Flavobacteriales bacterium]|nr:amidohydrolase family protein [Flavobacteriales bacterium]
MRNALTLLAALAACPVLAQRPAPAAPQTRSVLIRDAQVHTGDGRLIAGGFVGFRNGVIDHVGPTAPAARYDTVIDAAGGHLYPGFILPDATLGLAEIDQVHATIDEDEAGDITPEVRASTAYNVDSRIIPTVRRNGVLIAQVVPRGGVVSGRSSVVHLDAWDRRDALIARDNGVHLNWPRAFARHGWWAEPGPVVREKAEERQRRMRELEALFTEAAARARRPEAAPADVRVQALAGLFTGESTLFVQAEQAQDIQEAVLFADRMGVKRTVLVGGYDAWRVADLLRDKRVAVVLRRLHSLPLRNDDDVDLPFRLPALLHERGVPFCLSYTGDMERMGARNLPFVAGTARAYGLPPEEAVRCVTLDAARVLGIDARYGSLAVGKSATLFLSSGDALDMRTNAVRCAFIDGRDLTLDSTQEQLFEMHRSRITRP